MDCSVGVTHDDHMARRDIRMPPRLRLVGVLVTAAVTSLVGCNAAGDDGGGGGGAGPSFVLVTPNPVGVNDFFKLAVSGIEKAAEEHDGSQRVYESTDPASIQQNMAAAVRDEPDVIVAVGFNFAD